MTCCFFGHHDCSDAVKPLIRQKIMEMYEKYPDTVFYVGNQGRFDALVLSVFVAEKKGKRVVNLAEYTVGVSS